MEQQMHQARRSITTRFHRAIWNPFVEAVDRYRLIGPGDRVAVCISGGKDSTLLALCIQQLAQYGPIPFEARFLAMDPGYSRENGLALRRSLADLGIAAEIFHTRIYDIVANHPQGSPCFLCARMRRGTLYHKAQELGCNKIALGHHYDDVIETILMSMLYSARVRTMMPKLPSTSHPGMELIRPLYHVREQAILDWQRENGLAFLPCACRLTEGLAPGQLHDSKRAEVKALLASLRQVNRQIDANIFHSVQCVDLETVLGYKLDGVRHCFLDQYEK